MAPRAVSSAAHRDDQREDSEYALSAVCRAKATCRASRSSIKRDRKTARQRDVERSLSRKVRAAQRARRVAVEHGGWLVASTTLKAAPTPTWKRCCGILRCAPAPQPIRSAAGSGGSGEPSRRRHHWSSRLFQRRCSAGRRRLANRPVRYLDISRASVARITTLRPAASGSAAAQTFSRRASRMPSRGMPSATAVRPVSTHIA